VVPRDKNAFPNELPARALIARARARGALGALEGRIRLSYIYIWLRRREAESRVWGQVGLLLLACRIARIHLLAVVRDLRRSMF